MMQRLIEATMKRASLVIICILLIIVWGGISAYSMEREYLPPINNSTLMVSVRAENFEAAQVKQWIAIPLEQTLRSINGLDDIEMNSYNGGLLCSLYFPFNYDMARVAAATSQALAGVHLPSGVDKPLVTRISTDSFPILELSLMSQSHKLSETALRTSVQERVVGALKSIPGVQDIRTTGTGMSGYVLTVRMKDLKKFGLTMDDVKQSLSSIDPLWPQGKISTNQVSIPLRVTGWDTAEDIGSISVRGGDGKRVSLSNVADIQRTIVDVQTVSRTEGKPSVVLDVLKTPSSSISDVSARVLSQMHRLPDVSSGQVQVSVVYDRGNQIDNALIGLMREGLLGCLFSMLSVFLFLRNVRSTLLIALSLPICLLATTAIAKAMGISLNILTISGLIVAMGRVVDDSIVIIDNIYRRVQESKGKEHLGLFSGAVREMVPAIVSSTATTICVFVPVILVGGIVGASFSAFAWTIIIALMTSLLVALLIVPTFARFRKGEQSQANGSNVEQIAKRIFLWATRRKMPILFISTAAFIVSIIGACYLPVNFFPTSTASGEVSVQIELPGESTLAAVDQEARKVEMLLGTDQNVAAYGATLGSSFIPQFDDVFDPGGGWIQQNNIANLSVSLKPNVNLDAFMTNLRHNLSSLPSDATFTVTNKNISGDDSRMDILFTGADDTTLARVAQLASGKLQLVPGLSVEGAKSDENTTVYHITLNREKIDQLGVPLSDVLQTIGRYVSEGAHLTTTIDNQTVPIVIRSDAFTAVSNTMNASGMDPANQILAQLGTETFPTNDGKKIRLQQIAALSPSNGLPVISDRDGQPFARVSANIVSNDVEKVTRQTEDVLSSLKLPKGVQYSFGGTSAQVQEMMVEVAIALIVGIFLVLLIISSVFRGWKAPLSVFLCIPYALIGPTAGLFLIGGEWDLAAMVGVMMLVGIVVTNGIVLVDKIERNRAKGMPLQEAVLYGTLSRVRPVLMTACSTILTLLPLALSHRADTIVSQSLGVVVVGGMFTSTVISLLLIPSAYEWMHRQFSRRSVAKAEFSLKEYSQ